MALIGTYERSKLSKSYNALPKVRWSQWFMDLTRTTPMHATVGGLPLGAVAGWLLVAVTRSWRANYLVYEWFDPRHDQSQDRLEALLSKTGLDTLEPEMVWRAVRDAVQQVSGQSSDLRLWFLRQAALLEFSLRFQRGHRFGFDMQGIKRTSISLRNALRRQEAEALLCHSPSELEAATSDVATLAKNSMRAAVREICMTLAPHSQGQVTCNLMLPVSTSDEAAEMASLVVSQNKLDSHRSASRLWRGLEGRFRRVFTVAFQDDGDNFIGYWVPEIALTPGAAQAAREFSGSVVHSCDLPPMTQLGAQPRQDWEFHVKNTIKHDLFVSIPFVIAADEGALMTAAILNVNAICGNDPKVWPRAYHKEWLSLARDHASEALDTAFHAVRLFLELRARQMDRVVPALAIGDDIWDKSPFPSLRRGEPGTVPSPKNLP